MVAVNELHDKTYLGDGVYIGHDGWSAFLWTSDGVYVDNVIALEPEVLEAFDAWRWRMVQRAKDVIEGNSNNGS